VSTLGQFWMTVLT